MLPAPLMYPHWLEYHEPYYPSGIPFVDPEPEPNPKEESASGGRHELVMSVAKKAFRSTSNALLSQFSVGATSGTSRFGSPLPGYNRPGNGGAHGLLPGVPGSGAQPRNNLVGARVQRAAVASRRVQSAGGNGEDQLEASARAFVLNGNNPGSGGDLGRHRQNAPRSSAMCWPTLRTSSSNFAGTAVKSQTLTRSGSKNRLSTTPRLLAMGIGVGHSPQPPL
jgi:hypothetical protein